MNPFAQLVTLERPPKRPETHKSRKGRPTLSSRIIAHISANPGCTARDLWTSLNAQYADVHCRVRDLEAQGRLVVKWLETDQERCNKIVKHYWVTQ